MKNEANAWRALLKTHLSCPKRSMRSTHNQTNLISLGTLKGRKRERQFVYKCVCVCVNKGKSKRKIKKNRIPYSPFFDFSVVVFFFFFLFFSCRLWVCVVHSKMVRVCVCAFCYIRFYYAASYISKKKNIQHNHPTNGMEIKRKNQRWRRCKSKWRRNFIIIFFHCKYAYYYVSMRWASYLKI